tara:strand:+ start:1468 stop:1914 length:447 start_codon:yes stop_codon:yes gene_type:complete
VKLRNTVVAVIASALITPIASADVSFRDINLVEGEFESVYQFNKYMQRNNIEMHEMFAECAAFFAVAQPIYESMGEGESMHKKNIDLFLATQHFAGDETLSIVKRKATKYHQFFDRAVADNNGKYYGGRTGIAKGVCDDAHIFASAYK